MEDLTVLSPLGELSASSWRSWLPPHCLLVENYCLLVDNFTFRPVSDVTIRLLAFFFSPEDLLGRFFVVFRATFLSISLGGADIAVGLRC